MTFTPITPDELRLRQALLIYGANAAAFETIIGIARDMQRTAYEAGRQDQSAELVMKWSYSEQGIWQ